MEGIIMLNDPIIDEIHRHRKTIWHECNNNADDFIKFSMQNTENYKKQGWKIVTKKDLEKKEIDANK